MFWVEDRLFSKRNYSEFLNIREVVGFDGRTYHDLLFTGR